MPEITPPYEKIQHSMLYQFLDLEQRLQIQSNLMPQHILPSNENHIHYLNELKKYSVLNPD